MQAAMDVLTVEDDPEVQEMMVTVAEKDIEKNLNSDTASAAVADLDGDAEDEAGMEEDEADGVLIFTDEDMPLSYVL